VFQLLSGMQTLWEMAVGTVGGGDSSSRLSAVWVREPLAELTRERLAVPVNERQHDATLFLNGRARWRALPEVADPLADGWVGTIEGRTACVYAPPSLAGRLSPGALLDEARTSA